MAEPGSQIIIQILIVILLTAVNAFFAATEIAVVSVNKNRIKLLVEEGNKQAIKLDRLLQDSTNFLSTIQVAITLSGFFSSGSAATGLAPYLGQVLAGLGVPRAETVAFFGITIILSYLTLVFGELVPKQVGIRNAEKVALSTAGTVRMISQIAKPFVRFLSYSTKTVMKLMGVKDDDIADQVSREEIRSMVLEGQITGILNETEGEMIKSIFTFDDKLAKEVMTPRTEVYAIDVDSNLNDYIDEMLENMYSRIPVYENEIDNIIGVLYLKDFITEAYRVGFDNVNLRSILQEPYFIPERKNIDVLFRELQETKKHIALLLDEYGGFSGIVTIEDLIEEILGEIEDEFDDEEPEIIQVAENIYQLKGILHIVDLNEALNLDLDEDSEEYDSVGGLIIDILGYIPNGEEEEEIPYGNYIFRILEVKENRIEKVLLTILEPEDEADAETLEEELEK